MSSPTSPPPQGSNSRPSRTPSASTALPNYAQQLDDSVRNMDPNGGRGALGFWSAVKGPSSGPDPSSVNSTPDWNQKADQLNANAESIVNPSRDRLGKAIAQPQAAYEPPHLSPLALWGLIAGGAVANHFDRYNAPGGALVHNVIGGLQQGAQERYQRQQTEREQAIQSAKDQYQLSMDQARPMIDSANAMRTHGWDVDHDQRDFLNRKSLLDEGFDHDRTLAILAAKHGEAHSQLDYLHGVADKHPEVNWNLWYHHSMNGRDLNDPQAVNEAISRADQFMRLPRGVQSFYLHSALDQTHPASHLNRPKPPLHPPQF